VLAVLLIATIGVRQVWPMTVTVMRGARTSPMAPSTATAARRIPHAVCVLFGLFNNLSILAQI